ncbi:MAG: thioredoxin-like domain-containing protein [Candidatus Brocadiia bacterium]
MLAHDFDKSTRWLNAKKPISLRDLRGCIVVLDFWTYCCINCMHVLPILAIVEEEFRDEPLVVIGIHSGKFDAEKDDARIGEAIRRYGIAHPVAVDSEMKIWRQYGIRSWPTLVVIRPDGSIAAVAPGEPDPAMFRAFLRRELDDARGQKTLAEKAPDLVPQAVSAKGALLYPGKVISLAGQRIAISDSGHHRVLVCDSHGKVLDAIGSGRRGLAGGSFEDAAFDDPQGLAEWGGNLFVADRRNHCIRKLNLDRRTVETVAGDGTLGIAHPKGPVPALETPLRSPWDLCAIGDDIYVAMAGSHQIWLYNPIKGTIEAYSGTSVEGLVDGPIRGCSMAQPSGMSHREGFLYVVDSETSSIRAIDLGHGSIKTLFGTGLFDFGDSDGDAGSAMLQHPMGVAATPEGLYVADTYNGKIRLVDWDTKSVKTIASGLHEPGGIASSSDEGLLIADTNAHRILLLRDSQMTTIEITNAPVPRTGSIATAPKDHDDLDTENWFTSILELPDGVGLAPGEGKIVLELVFAEGSKFAAGETIRINCEVARRPDLLAVKSPEARFEGGDSAQVALTLPVTVAPFAEEAVDSEITAALEYVRCDFGGYCTPLRSQLRIPVRLLQNGTETLLFTVEM